MTGTAKLAHDCRGTSAIEFALVAPLLITILLGLLQVGILFNANAGLRNAVAEGARFATTFPAPSNDQIIARTTGARFGLKPTSIVGPIVTRGEEATSSQANAPKIKFVEVTMSYATKLDFVFFAGPTVTLKDTRRAYHP